ncbi:MAG: hypothetical protein AB1896_07675, partial [Thermodesulfobacteriota bacterium]
MSSDEVVKADPGARRVVLILVAAALVFSAVLILKLLPLFQVYLRTLPPPQAISTLRLVLMLLFLSVLPAGLY